MTKTEVKQHIKNRIIEEYFIKENNNDIEFGHFFVREFNYFDDMSDFDKEIVKETLYDFAIFIEDELGLSRIPQWASINSMLLEIDDRLIKLYFPILNSTIFNKIFHKKNSSKIKI